MIKDYSIGVSHTAFEREPDHAESLLQDLARARDGLATVFRSPPDSAVRQVALVTSHERERRHGFFSQYLGLTGVQPDRQILRRPNVVPHALIEFDSRQSQSNGHILPEGYRGLSLELAHCDQYGAWASARPLDDLFRALPSDRILADCGFKFTDTYLDHDQARIGYSFRIMPPGPGAPPSVFAVRKRAVADISSSSDHSISIVKRSVFALDVSLSTREERNHIDQAVDATATIDSLKSKAQMLLTSNEIDDKSQESLSEIEQNITVQRDLVNETGFRVVESCIADPERRQRQKNVLAVTSLYFALHRES